MYLSFSVLLPFMTMINFPEAPERFFLTAEFFYCTKIVSFTSYGLDFSGKVCYNLNMQMSPKKEELL